MSDRENSGKEETFAGCLFWLGMLTICLVISVFLNGVTISYLWEWFVIPVFPAARSLTIASAIGISVIVSYLTYQQPSEKKDSKGTMAEKASSAMVSMLARPLVTFVLGNLVHQFV